METIKLIPMTQWVIENYPANPQGHQSYLFGQRCISYAKFLSRPLTLSMFVPTTEAGEVLEEPESLKGYYETHRDGMEQEKKDVEAYLKAKSRCLFEGFEVVKTGIKTPWQTHNKGCPIDQFVSAYRMGSATVESMLSSVEPFLTQTAITQIFG